MYICIGGHDVYHRKGNQECTQNLVRKSLWNRVPDNRLGGAYREAANQVEVIVKICSMWIGFHDYDGEPQGSVTAVSWLSDCR
jgi:hypothetical protein